MGAERGQDGAPNIISDTQEAGGPECIKKDGVPHAGWKTRQIISQTSDSPSLGANYTPLQTDVFGTFMDGPPSSFVEMSPAPHASAFEARVAQSCQASPPRLSWQR